MYVQVYIRSQNCYVANIGCQKIKSACFSLSRKRKKSFSPLNRIGSLNTFILQYHKAVLIYFERHRRPLLCVSEIVVAVKLTHTHLARLISTPAFERILSFVGEMIAGESLSSLIYACFISIQN